MVIEKHSKKHISAVSSTDLRRRNTGRRLSKYQNCYIITGDNQIKEAVSGGLLWKRGEIRICWEMSNPQRNKDQELIRVLKSRNASGT